jgi:hypothetical protein
MDLMTMIMRKQSRKLNTDGSLQTVVAYQSCEILG